MKESSQRQKSFNKNYRYLVLLSKMNNLSQIILKKYSIMKIKDMRSLFDFSRSELYLKNHNNLMIKSSQMNNNNKETQKIDFFESQCEKAEIEDSEGKRIEIKIQ